MAQNAPMNDDIHDDIEDSAQRSDAAEVKERGQKHRQYDGVDEGVPLDIPRHAEMAVWHQLHIGQHCEHARDCENAGDHARYRRDNGESNRKP